MTLFHAPRSRSSRIIFLQEEPGALYRIKTVGIRRGDGTGVFESAAIACCLTDKFPDAGIRLRPARNQPPRFGAGTGARARLTAARMANLLCNRPLCACTVRSSTGWPSC